MTPVAGLARHALAKPSPVCPSQTRVFTVAFPTPKSSGTYRYESNSSSLHVHESFRVSHMRNYTSIRTNIRRAPYKSALSYVCSSACHFLLMRSHSNSGQRWGDVPLRPDTSKVVGFCPLSYHGTSTVHLAHLPIYHRPSIFSAMSSYLCSLSPYPTFMLSISSVVPAHPSVFRSCLPAVLPFVTASALRVPSAAVTVPLVRAPRQRPSPSIHDLLSHIHLPHHFHPLSTAVWPPQRVWTSRFDSFNRTPMPPTHSGVHDRTCILESERHWQCCRGKAHAKYSRDDRTW